jgi:hypothetical protein
MGITKRPVISADLQWDNNRKSFPELKNRLEAHIIQAGMIYMIKPRFVKRYKLHGLKVLNFYKDTLEISKEQFKHDIDVMYGYLKSAFRSGLALKHLRTHNVTYDGILVYDLIDQEFGLGGDENVLIQHYEGIINEKYHRDHPDGITVFVDHLENAFAKLESLEEEYPDRKKFQFLTRNLLVVGLTDWMVGHCESHFSGKAKSFKKSCQWFRAKDAQSAYSRMLANSMMDDGNAREERGAHEAGPGKNTPFDRGKRGDEYLDQVSSYTNRDVHSQQNTIGDNRSSFQLVHQLLDRRHQ